jgi:glucokinase
LPANSASERSTDFSHEHRLLGDIGATNVRFALLSNGVLGPIKWFTVTDFPRFTDAVNAFLDGYCRQVSVCEALLAVAGPVDKDRCVLTNSAWTIDAAELCGAFSFAKVHILNDFEATALSLPLLTAADLYPVGGGEAVLGAPMAVLGPGTGLGVACFVPGSHLAAPAHDRNCAGFRPPAMTIPTTCSGGRRPKSAKARNRGK